MRRLIILGLLGLALSSCVTPSIPIPPPDPQKMAFVLVGMGTETRASFTYEPEINYIGAIVFVYNRDKGVGIIANANGDGGVGPTAPVAATLGDQIVVSFEREDQTVSTCIKLREGQQSSTDFCGP